MFNNVIVNNTSYRYSNVANEFKIGKTELDQTSVVFTIPKQRQ